MPLQTDAILLTAPRQLSLASVALKEPGPRDLVVRIDHSGISTGTEKLFWSGAMPPFPGMGYPLVPGYEAAGEVVEAGADTGYHAGDRVFVPGANCFGQIDGVQVYGLFGGASRMLVSDASRVTRIDAGMGETGALLALAATARHALAVPNATLPDLIVGHGVLGRLLARITVAMGGPAPTVWEINAKRQSGASGYSVCHPDTDTRRDYRSVYDVSGAEGLLDQLIGRLAKGGEVVLAGFYTQPLQFTFVPAFLREARLRIAAEWQADDLEVTRALIDAGTLSLDGLITHHARPVDAAQAYELAFSDADCLKMILNWENNA